MNSCQDIIIIIIKATRLLSALIFVDLIYPSLPLIDAYNL
ncbi:unnamed protein product [Spirodela intermedia]|uniref:Uncharacterized protein n=2 Tax=Spirodela intermedia TaxID=51605 RepID=A0A7I8LII9_SPIIN|nr:unnamed protein product [Spirodela intermedia]CAA6672618.1 unnamed protein product [Spirodela intermedia]CAA7409841.1 unnamed protein product [Spirodela intermedia]